MISSTMNANLWGAHAPRVLVSAPPPKQSSYLRVKKFAMARAPSPPQARGEAGRRCAGQEPRGGVELRVGSAFSEARAIRSVARSSAIGSMLFNTSAYDPLTLGTITVLLAAFALVACFFPANRATKVNPIEALRSE